MRARIAALAGAAVLALGVVAGTTPNANAASKAPVTVRPQVGMAGITLGMKATAVRSMLGVPARIIKVQGGLAPYVKWRYPKLGLVVGLIGPQYGMPTVLDLTTNSRRARTPKHVGVGSTKNQIWSAYPQAECSTYRGRFQCRIGEPGMRTTNFQFSRGRVRSISMGDVF